MRCSSPTKTYTHERGVIEGWNGKIGLGQQLQAAAVGIYIHTYKYIAASLIHTNIYSGSFNVVSTYNTSLIEHEEEREERRKRKTAEQSLLRMYRGRFKSRRRQQLQQQEQR